VQKPTRRRHTKSTSRARGAPSKSIKKTSATKRKRGASEVERDFEVFIEIRRHRGRALTKKTKAVSKSETEKIGPIRVPITTDWDDFLISLAGNDGLDCTVNNLRTPTFHWKFVNPATSPLLPLKIAAALELMIGQMKEKNKFLVTVVMDEPKKSRQQVCFIYQRDED
jgi:hypothetical protein